MSEQKLLDSRGYEMLVDGRAVHRVNYEAAYGAPPAGWHVHHVDYNRFNNDASNLIALPPALHMSLHKEHPHPSHTRDQLVRMVAPWQKQYDDLFWQMAGYQGKIDAIRKKLQSDYGVNFAEPKQVNTKAKKQKAQKKAKRQKAQWKVQERNLSKKMVRTPHQPVTVLRKNT